MTCRSEDGGVDRDVPNWDEFQHYKDRSPPWIKVYTSLLHNDAYLGLSPHQRAVLHGLWLMYASHRREVNSLPTPRQSHVSSASESRQQQLKALVDAGFIEVSASKPAVETASLEVEVEKKVLSGDAAAVAPGARRRLRKNGKRPVDKRRRYDELLAAGKRFAADWKGGTSMRSTPAWTSSSVSPAQAAGRRPVQALGPGVEHRRMRAVLYGPPNWLVEKFSSEDRRMFGFWTIVLATVGAMFFGREVLYVTVLSILALIPNFASETPVEEESAAVREQEA
jgi:hypothetical protein